MQHVIVHTDLSKSGLAQIVDTSVTAVQQMPQQLCIVVHPVEMGGAIALQTCTVSGNQTIKATHVYFIEGGEFMMQRVPREGSEGDSGSRI